MRRQRQGSHSKSGISTHAVLITLGICTVAGVGVYLLFTPAAPPDFLTGPITAARWRAYSNVKTPRRLSEQETRTVVARLRGAKRYGWIDMHVGVRDTDSRGFLILTTPTGRETLHVWANEYFHPGSGRDWTVRGNRLRCPGLRAQLDSIVPNPSRPSVAAVQ